MRERGHPVGQIHKGKIPLARTTPFAPTRPHNLSHATECPGRATHRSPIANQMVSARSEVGARIRPSTSMGKKKKKKKHGPSGTRWWGTRGSRSAASPFARVSRHTMYFSALGTRHTHLLCFSLSALPPPGPRALEQRPSRTQTKGIGAILPPLDANLRGMMMSSSTHAHRGRSNTTNIKHHHHHHHHHHQAHHSIIIRRSRRRIDMSSSGYRDEDISRAFRSERREAPYTNRPRVRPSAEIVPRKLSRGNPAEIPSSPRSYE